MIKICHLQTITVGSNLVENAPKCHLQSHSTLKNVTITYRKIHSVTLNIHISKKRRLGPLVAWFPPYQVVWYFFFENTSAGVWCRVVLALV
jgi:hypothetical protein